MDQQARDFLLQLLNTPSPSGFETAGQQVWMDHVRRFADDVASDTYGSAWATLKGPVEGAPRLMLEAHADEIGFMVQHITDEGFLRITPIGGSDRAIVRARRVHVLTGNGPVGGVIGHTAIHLRKKDDDKIPEWEDLFVDIGAATRGEVAARGVRIGHPIVLAETVGELIPGRLVGRAIDNRIGGFVIAQALVRLAGDRPPATVYAVNAVQEEIGGGGAQMITYRLQPSIAIAFDVTHATDSPGINKAKHGRVKLGKGPTVTHGTANHPKVVERLIAVAEEAGIPLQHEASSRNTGTDTDRIFTARSGVPSALVSVPLRYMHSPVEVVDLGDVEHCIALLTAFARSIREDDTFQVAMPR